jgi:hypothetical protein
MKHSEHYIANCLTDLSIFNAIYDRFLSSPFKLIVITYVARKFLIKNNGEIIVVIENSYFLLKRVTN